MEPRTDPRTKWDSDFELDYAVAMASIHARAFRRWQRGIGALNMFSGGGTFMTAITGYPYVAAFLGLLTSGLSAYDFFWKPGEAADKHDGDKKRFVMLKSRNAGMTMEHLDRDLNKIRADAAPTFDVLGLPVYNEVCRTLGCGGEKPLTRRQRLARWLT